LEELVPDGLVEPEPSGLRVTERGKPFVRNIALALDAHYWAGRPQGQVFSRAV
jgi:oxygen-independent coproporphyrinogen-3 oxidase